MISSAVCSLIFEHLERSAIIVLLCAMLIMKVRKQKNSAMEKKLNKSTSLQNSHIFDKKSDIEMDKFSQAEAALGVWLDNTLTDSSKSITMQLNFSDDFILDIPDDAEVSLFINKNNL